MPEPLLTKGDVSRILARSIPALDRDIRDGLLPFIKLGKSIRFRPEDVSRIRDEGFSSHIATSASENL
jgi:hypothetical protein